MKLFFKQLGARIAALRKMVASYEVGRRRVPVSLLPPTAETLHRVAR